NDDDDEGIPLVNHVIFTSNLGNRVVLDDDQDDILYIQPNYKPKKKSCSKGCCGATPKVDQAKELKPQQIINDEDEGIIKMDVNNSFGSKVTLDLDQEDIVFIQAEPTTKEYSGLISTPISTLETPSQTIKTTESKCKKGCCGPKLDSSITSTPIATLETPSQIMETKVPENKCKKGCCGPKEKPELTPISTSETPNVDCKKGCCPPKETPIKKTYCCEICIDGHCCKSNCCEQLCCLTYSLKVPSFLTSQASLEEKPKRFFATIFSKTCGSFGFKVGYSELDEAETNNGNNSTLSIELLESDKQELFLVIGGMTCADCVTTLEDTIKSLPGVIDISTSLFTGKCKITYSPTYIQPMDIQKSIVTIGFQASQDAGPDLNQINIGFDSSTNKDSLLNLIEELSKQDKIINEIQLKETNNNQEYLSISYNIDEIGPRKLFNDISKQLKEKCGAFLVNLISDPSVLSSDSSNNTGSTLKELLILSILFFVPTIFVAFIASSISALDKIFAFEFEDSFTVSTLLLWIFATPVQFYVGKPLYISAWKTLIYAKKCSMDLLVMTSSSIAYVYSMINVFINLSTPEYEGPIFFEVSTILLTLIILGRYLEYLAKCRASESLFEKISQLDSPNAILLDINEDEQIIDKQLIEKGDILKVLPFSKIPTDGIIVKGNGYIDESIITGESAPVFKGENQNVFGGSMNQKNSIHIKASKNSNDTTLANIVKLIQEGQATKPPFQNIADKVASYFVPSIFAFGIIMFVVWFCLAHYDIVDTDGQNAFTFAIKIAMAVLVISCPCAISLATPTSIMVGSGVAAKHGILFKGGDVIESTHKIKTIVFDKTGTLTTGNIEISHFIVYDQSLTPKDLFFYCGSTELASEHHIGKAIKKYAVNQLICNLVEPESSEIYPGKGISAIIEGESILVGNKAFMSENNIEITDQAILDFNKYESQSKTVVLVSKNDKLIGLVSLQDTIKPEASHVITKLLKNGIDCWIVSGDNQKSVESIAKTVGIELSKTIHSASPMDKYNFIKKLQQDPLNNDQESGINQKKDENIVAMIGDGVNDSLALTQADVGISISSGTDIAIESAQVILMKNDLVDILVAIDLSKVIFKTIKRNLMYAFLYNLIGIPLSAGLLYPFFRFTIPPSISGVSELLSSLPVVLFSLTINTFKYDDGN
ncbi:hypothetical protein DICPUDRAFT_14789, partial [Dictyostelium purpureum]